MKNQTTEKLLLTLVLCGLGFTCLGFTAVEPRCPANQPQGDQAEKPTQLGYGRAPHPPLPQGDRAEKPTQLGYGRAPHPPLPQGDQAEKPTQLGYRRAPQPCL